VFVTVVLMLQGALSQRTQKNKWCKDHGSKCKANNLELGWQNLYIEGRYLFYRPALEQWIEGAIVHHVTTTTAGLAADATNDIWKHSKGGKSWP